MPQSMAAGTGGMAGSSGGSSVRSLPFGVVGGAAPAGAPATRLQAPPGSSSVEDGADIYLLLVQARALGASLLWRSRGVVVDGTIACASTCSPPQVEHNVTMLHPCRCC